MLVTLLCHGLGHRGGNSILAWASLGVQPARFASESRVTRGQGQKLDDQVKSTSLMA
jgi:hypothetical protein